MKHQDLWESQRMNAYVTAQCNSTKQLKPQSIISFPWENMRRESELPSEDEIKKMSEMSKSMESVLKEKFNKRSN